MSFILFAQCFFVRDKGVEFVGVGDEWGVGGMGKEGRKGWEQGTGDLKSYFCWVGGCRWR